MIVIGLVVLAAAIRPSLFTALNPNSIDPNSVLAGPSSRHLLGTDEAGGDIYTRLVYGTRLDLEVSLISVAIAYLVAVPLGVIAARLKGPADEVLSGITGGVLALPIVLFAMLIVGSFGASAGTLIAIFAIAFFPQVALLARAQAKAVLERDYVVAARVGGLREWKILTSHVLPNISGPLVVLWPQLMATAILAEAGLSYLGLGVQPPAVTWGSILQDSTNYYQADPLYSISAGVAVVLAAALLLLSGDLLAESMNPQRRR
jgi:peptide/nickel transport system permease protein